MPRRKQKKTAVEGKVQRFIPSGSIVLDYILGGNGGWPLGRLINVVGDSSTGKSLLMLEAAANHYDMFPDGDIVMIETEAAFDARFARAVGFPIDHALFVNTEDNFKVTTIEEFFDWMKKYTTKRVELLEEGKELEPAMIVLDSLDGLSSKAELARDLEDGTYGMEKAKAISIGFRQLMQRMRGTQMTLFVVSQTRDKIGVTFGSKKTRSGGRALEFYSSLVVWLAHLKALKRMIDGAKEPFGTQIKAQVKKTRVGPCYREGVLELHYEYGVEDLMTCGLFLDEKGVKYGKKRLDLLKVATGEDGEAYRELLDELKGLVQAKWDKIASDFASKRRKYAGRSS